MKRYLFPAIVISIFLVLSAFLYIGLDLNPREVPSPLIGKPAPDFSLQNLKQPTVQITPKDMQGQVWLLNVWASWCVSCRQEHPLLVELSRQGLVPIYGLNYKDNRADAQRWLVQLGDPYVANAFDADGRTGIDWGVYGAPETFIMDKDGIIRHKHIGPLTREAVEQEILPLIAQLEAAQ